MGAEHASSEYEQFMNIWQARRVSRSPTAGTNRPLPPSTEAPTYHRGGSVLPVAGLIPVALSKSEGAGSVWALAQLPGAHLYIQVLGNKTP